MQIKPTTALSHGNPSVPSIPTKETKELSFVRSARSSATAESGLDPKTRELVSNVVKACETLNLPEGQSVPAYINRQTMAVQKSTNGTGFWLQDLAKPSSGRLYPTALYMSADGRMKIDGEDVGIHSRRYGEAMRMLNAFSQSLERGGVQARKAVADE